MGADRERAQQQEREILEALLVAIDRRVDVSEAVVSSDIESDAVERLRGLLDVSELVAVEILNMQWRRFTRSSRAALLDRLTGLENER